MKENKDNIISFDKETEKEKRDKKRMKELNDFVMNADMEIILRSMIGESLNKLEEEYVKKYNEAKKELHELLRRYGKKEEYFQ